MNFVIIQYRAVVRDKFGLYACVFFIFEVINSSFCYIEKIEI